MAIYRGTEANREDSPDTETQTVEVPFLDRQHECYPVEITYIHRHDCFCDDCFDKVVLPHERYLTYADGSSGKKSREWSAA